MPAPKRSVPLLPCAKCKDNTRHVFERTRSAAPQHRSPVPGGNKPGQAVIYRCRECDTERVWGFEEAE